jgi:hypothetical protein
VDAGLLLKFYSEIRNVKLGVRPETFCPDHEYSEPENVLTNDSKRWQSQSRLKDWIQFHFLKSSVLIDRYLLRTDFERSGFYVGGITDWVIEGSIDSLSWELIDQKTQRLEFGDNSNHTFSCSSQRFYRFIRFTFHPQFYNVYINYIELSGKILRE